MWLCHALVLAGIYPRRMSGCLLVFPLAKAKSHESFPLALAPASSFPSLSTHQRLWGLSCHRASRRWGQAVAVTALAAVPVVPGSPHGQPRLQECLHAGLQEEANPEHLLSVGKSLEEGMDLGSVVGSGSPVGLGMLRTAAEQNQGLAGSSTVLLSSAMAGA